MLSILASVFLWCSVFTPGDRELGLIDSHHWQYHRQHGSNTAHAALLDITHPWPTTASF